MSPPRYVFVFGDLDRAFTTTDEPTPEDLAHAAAGTEVIIRLADVHFFGRAGKWLPVEKGTLGTAEVEERITAPFHAPSGYFADPLPWPSVPPG